MIDELEIKYDIKKLPFDYILLKWRLIINKQLYDEKTIDINTFSEMENNILKRMEKIINEYSNS